jgi:hypothetical protein
VVVESSASRNRRSGTELEKICLRRQIRGES